ncbi:hypothetical protein D1609_09745 [Leptospira borgpetersenii serovar Hardjo-bovis]|nr:hypothetical protein D1609_09745 [Leptospira borgpetersenii serovar Hardjo-bovis]TQE53441.1 hypothetical protein FFZ95_07360 [Leptospira borgpetersenii]TQE57163.1 hypothetical protein FFZ96_07690 [Leptospira borgpetersenii]
MRLCHDFLLNYIGRAVDSPRKKLSLKSCPNRKKFMSYIGLDLISAKTIADLPYAFSKIDRTCIQNEIDPCN